MATLSMAITATDLVEYSFCPRFLFFERFLSIQEYQEKRYKVQKGRDVHRQRQKTNPKYLRRKVACKQRSLAVRLYAEGGLMSGEVDEVLFLQDGSAAPLDYKWAEWKGAVFQTHRLQLAFYSRLIEENYQQPVHFGLLVYVRSKHKLVKVPLLPEHYKQLESAMLAIQEICIHGYFPAPTTTPRACADCCYKNACESY